MLSGIPSMIFYVVIILSIIWIYNKVSGFFKDVIEHINKLTKVITQMYNTVKGAVNTGVKELEKTGNQIGKGVTNTGKDTGKGITNTAKKVRSGLKKTFQ